MDIQTESWKWHCFLRNVLNNLTEVGLNLMLSKHLMDYCQSLRWKAAFKISWHRLLLISFKAGPLRHFTVCWQAWGKHCLLIKNCNSNSQDFDQIMWCKLYKKSSDFQNWIQFTLFTFHMTSQINVGKRSYIIWIGTIFFSFVCRYPNSTIKDGITVDEYAAIYSVHFQ